MNHRWLNALTALLLLLPLAAPARAGDSKNVAAQRLKALLKPGGEEAVSDAAAYSGPYVKVTDVALKGEIHGENITFNLTCSVRTTRHRQEMPLIAGDTVLKEVRSPARSGRLRLDRRQGIYYMSWPRAGRCDVDVDFACRPLVVGDGQWRESFFSIPSSNIRNLQVTCDRTDLEVQFPGAMRFEREVKEGVLTVRALMGPSRPFGIRWKPQVQELEAKLVFSSDANTIVTAGVGAMRVDSLFMFDVSQGKMRRLEFSVPDTLSVTQVRGAFIQDWQITDAENSKALSVTLNRPQVSRYALQVISETPLADFPLDMDLPVVEPANGIRAAGSLAVGTDSAIRLLTKRTGGLSQVDAAAFPRVVLERKQPRRLPANNAFYYSYATAPFQMGLALSDIVPAFDAAERFSVNVKEDDVVAQAEIDLDVRDAAVRSIEIEVGDAFMVSDVSGAMVDDYNVRPGKPQVVEVRFKAPVLGHTLLRMRLELGRGPLGAAHTVGGFAVRGARNERGFIVIGAEQGVELDPPETKQLREVHTGSVQMRVPDARFAYRFRNPGWQLVLRAGRKPSSVRTEALHLVSLGEGISKGSVAVTYFISGAPVDELHFRVAPELNNVEFVSRDVRHWTRNGDLWTVHLQRKILGDYNLLVTYDQRYKAAQAVLVGGVECSAVDTQSGYLVVASRFNLRLSDPGAPQTTLLEVGPEEVPVQYRLPVNSPILKTYKYVDAPHRVSLTVDPYDRSSLLSVVIDVTDIDSDIVLERDGLAESRTRMRCKVKNANAQFLSLAMPEGAQLWSTRVTGTDASGNQVVRRVTAGYDRANGRWIVPLPRHRDPNLPATVEIEYGQSHGRLGWSGLVRLLGPRPDAPSSFARWTIRGPSDTAIIPGPGNLVCERADLRRAGLDLSLRGVLGAFLWALERWWFWITFAAVALVALAAVLKATRLIGWPAVAGVVPLLWLLIGLCAMAKPGFPASPAGPRDLNTAVFNQVLSYGPESLRLSFRLVPAWRKDASFAGAVLVPILGLASLAAAFLTRRRRVVLAAFGVAAIAYGAAQFSPGAAALGHFFAWLLPLLLAAALLGRDLPRRLWRAAGRRALPAVLLFCASLVIGCAAPLAAADDTCLERVECKLSAEEDSMSITLLLAVNARRPLLIPLLPRSDILLSPDGVPRRYEMVERNGRYCVRTLHRGPQSVELKFLSRLEKPDENQVRQFRMPLPPALTNRVSLEIPRTGIEVEAPTAILLTREETDTAVRADAVFGPSDDLFFIWKPRARQTRLEKPVYYAELTCLACFDAGLVECRHSLRLQIAQGELKNIRLLIPEKMTVTAVDGGTVGAWRFEPASRLLEVHLTRPASGEYRMRLVTQISSDSLPYTAEIRMPQVVGAARQRGTLGVAVGAAVFANVKSHPQAMNAADFSRDAAVLIAEAAGIDAAGIRRAFRFSRPADLLTAEVIEVRPEIRTEENGSFSVADDRLVYNCRFAVNVAKAGVFSIDLALPENFDIDKLSAPQVSHWDERTGGEPRTVQVFFKRRLMGTAVLSLTLSRAVSDLPEKIAVPRISAVGTLKHQGLIAVRKDSGLRLSVAEKKGVSELDPAELDVRDLGTLVFKLLRPDWAVTLNTEVIKARVVVDFLHQARITDGLVRHVTYLRFLPHNAGVKVFRVRLPAKSMGVEIVGPLIADIRREKADPAVRRVELESKWKRAYPLTVQYETKYDRSAGEVPLAPATALGVELQRGYAVVHATEKVEIRPVKVSESLQPAEARGVSRLFGAGDLSSAAFCYTCPAPDYELLFRATRHEAAEVLKADVERVLIQTVANELGRSINRVRIMLRVAGKRYLETRLPAGAELWTLLVNDRREVPSLKKPTGGDVVYLIPLNPEGSGETVVVADFTYVVPAPPDWSLDLQTHLGPKFDLPLEALNWVLYLPEDYVYTGFVGTISPVERTPGLRVLPYDVRTYDEHQQRLMLLNQKTADKRMKLGAEFAQKGEQRKARQALESAYVLSLSRRDLNEDARVKLQALTKEQAVVGLLGRRDWVRPKTGRAAGEPALPAERDLGDRFSRQQAERLKNSLSEDDSKNLELIAGRLIEQQEAAAHLNWPLYVNMAVRGRELRFHRAIQVKPNADMLLSFRAEPARFLSGRTDWLWGLAVFGFLAAAFALLRLSFTKD